MQRTSVSALAVLFVTGVVLAAAPGEKRLPGIVGAPPAPLVADKPASANVAQLIKDLGSDEYRTREKAGAALIVLGEQALPDMRAALLATENPEVQRRLAVLVRKLDYERLVAPKRITLSIKNKPIKEILDQIAKQSGYKIDFSGGGRGAGGADGELQHSFEFENTPFWVAIDKVAAAGGCVVFADYGDDNIRVYNQGTINPHVSYAGPFRFLATNINSSKNVQLSGINPRAGGGNNRYESMNLNFQIQSEPKNPMLGVTQAEVISAVDELGGSLMLPKDPNNRSNYQNNNSFRGHNSYCNVNLTRLDNKTATTIQSLKIKMGVILLAGTIPEITITDPLKAKGKTFVGRTVEVELSSLTEDPNTKGNYLLEVTCKKLGNTNPQNEDYNWANTIWQKFELSDATGNRYQCFGPNKIENNGNTVKLTLPFGVMDRQGNPVAKKLGAPTKLVLTEWLSVTHEVTFEFKNIPLP